MNLSKKYLAPLAMSFAISAAAVPAFAESNDNTVPSGDNHTMSFSCDTPDMSGLSRMDRIDNIMPATVFIQAITQGAPSMMNPSGQSGGTGSGFIVDREGGYIVTNHHVIDGATDISVVLYDPDKTDNQGERHSVTLVGTDPVLDVAVLKLESETPLRNCVNLGDSDSVRVGQDVMAIGNPSGMSFTATFGTVSNTQRFTGNFLYNFIQTDTPINPGNSGGGLYNQAGEVIGINVAIRSRVGESNGLGIVIKANDAREVVDEIIRTGEAQRANIGIQTAGGVSPQVAEEFGGYVGEGFIVGEIAEDSPTYLAGLREDDIIMKINGQSFDNLREGIRILGNFEPDDVITLQIIRNRMLQTITVDFAAKPEELPEVVVAEAAIEPEPEAETAEADTPEVEAPEEDAPEADAPEAEAPEEDVPEADAPEAEAPEEDAPEVDTPEAEAPEEDAPEEDAPEAEALEEDAPEADAPEAEAPEEEAPEEDAPEAEAPEEDAPEASRNPHPQAYYVPEGPGGPF